MHLEFFSAIGTIDHGALSQRSFHVLVRFHVWRSAVNAAAVLSLLITLAEFVLGFAVWSRNPRRESHRLFFAFVITLVLWGLSDFGIRLSQDLSAADPLHKLGAIGFCLFPAVFLHFSFVYTGYGVIMQKPFSLVALYGSALALIMFHIMGFITNVSYSTDGPVSVEHTIGYNVYVIWVLTCAVTSAGLMVRRYRESTSGGEKGMMLFAIAGLAVAVVAGLLIDALIPLYGFRPLITGGATSLLLVAVFSALLIRMSYESPTAEIVAERVLDTTGDLVCVIGVDGYLSFATDVFRRTIELNREEGIRRIHIRDIVQDGDRILERIGFGEEDPAPVEAQFMTRTGMVFPVSLSISRLADGTKSLGYVLIGRDISERQELTRRFEESQEKYQHIVESSLDGIVIIQDGGLVFVNPSAVRIFGFESAREMIGSSFNDTVAPGSKPFLLGNYQHKRIGEDIFRNYEMKGLTKAGKIIDLEINARLVTWNAKPAVQASFRDITERKDLERDQAVWFWEQESLRSIDQQLAAMFDLESVLDTVSRNARAFSRADFSGVILAQESRMYRWRGVKGNRVPVEGRYRSMKKSHKNLFDSGKPLVLNDLGKRTDFPIADFPVLASEGLSTVAIFPFRIKENHEGVLAVGFRADRRLTEREFRLLASLADKAAIALANAGLYEDLRERELELERLTDARVEAQEDERRRIAREIHDGLGQMLSAIKFHVEVLEDTRGLGEVDRKKLLDVKELLDNVMTEAREISHNLMPSVLEDFGLNPALRLLCESFGNRLGIPIAFHSHGVDGRMEHGLEINLYRIAQEALNNISKHADAKSVDIQLILDKNGVRLTVEDDGKGFERRGLPKAPGRKGGMGLISMRQRAASFGGTLTIESNPGNGTTILIEIPRTRELNHESN